jgi:hypothetical protein
MACPTDLILSWPPAGGRPTAHGSSGRRLRLEPPIRGNFRIRSPRSGRLEGLSGAHWNALRDATPAAPLLGKRLEWEAAPPRDLQWRGADGGPDSTVCVGTVNVREAQEGGPRQKGVCAISVRSGFGGSRECFDVEAPNMGDFRQRYVRRFGGRVAFSRRRRLAGFPSVVGSHG